MAVPQNPAVSSVDNFFLLVISFFIFFIQAGLAFLEAGASRLKNTTDIIIKKMIILFTCALMYWLFGYAFAWGEKSNLFLSHSNFALSDLPESTNIYVHWLLHFTLAAFTCSIVSGALAERTNFTVYTLFTVLMSGFIYPVVTHWCWHEEGWLKKGDDETLGEGVSFQDFAGSGVIHVTAGTMALVGSAVIGPRCGRFERGKPVPIGGHTVPLAAFGGYVCLLGFLAVICGNQGHVTSRGDTEAIALIAINTILSSSGGALTAFFIRRTWGACYGHHSSVLTMINGALTGAVSISAGGNEMHPYAAFIVGFIAGATYIAWDIVLLHLKVDDPVTATSVHLGGGMWGLLAAPLLDKNDGILYVGDKLSFKILGWNLLGGVAIIVWSALISAILFLSLRFFKKLKVTAEAEAKGLDISKHGEPAYPIGAYAESSSYQYPKTVLVNERTNPAFSNMDASMSSQPSESMNTRGSTSAMS
ncbi:putative ammonium transporter 1 [Dendronephthya gigantea]|uniref:putative ammonium transporter 1 n=1 Tax=Dendronephthya gigantea TaxID=151771 RepID=UPI001068FFD3|nr:putative ammonium transporter 1 [Dendronephthya gigantea]